MTIANTPQVPIFETTFLSGCRLTNRPTIIMSMLQNIMTHINPILLRKMTTNPGLLQDRHTRF